jgi:hypothetical protein
MNKTKLAIAVPTRGRPHNLQRLAEAIEKTATVPHEIFARIDDDDKSEYPKLKNVRYVYGPRIYFAKSVNELAQIALDEKFTHLAILGDDVVPQTVGWDEMLIKSLPGLGVAYGSDGLENLHGADLPTHVVVPIEMYKLLGWIALPELRHLYCDNVWRELGKLTNFVYSPEVKLTHLHRWNKTAPDDKTYQEANDKNKASVDFATFQKWRTGPGRVEARRKLTGEVLSVAALSYAYPPGWSLGGEVALHRILNVLDANKTVLTETKSPYVFESVNVKQIDTPDVFNILSDPVPIAKQLKELKADVVIGQGELSLAAVVAANKLNIVSVIGVHAPPKHGKKLRQAVIEADYAIYNTNTSATLWGERNALVIHPPVEKLPKKLSKTGDAYTCLSSLKNKGVEVMLSLAEMYPDKRFIIVRSPAEPTHGIPDLEERAAKLPNVELHPRVEPKDVYKYFEQTRILLVPSVYETYGMSAIEAAGYGIPSIHVDTPHVREGIGTAAVLIRPLSVEDAAKGIDMIEKDYDTYSGAVRERAEWIQDRQNKEIEEFKKFIYGISKPKTNELRKRSVTRSSRQNS